MDTRWNDILTIWKQWRGSYELTFGVMLVLLGIWIGSLFFAADAGYGTNLYTEALGVLVTIAVLNTFARQREQAQLKNRLVREAASRDNSTAVSAVDWMRHEDWLTGDDGLLKEADLSNANLENADFGREANLPGANLWRANLPGADLFQANLPGAKLSFVNLTGADLRGANLTRADLTFANLTGADLTFANLTGADLKDANLTDADLTFANLTGADLKGCQSDRRKPVASQSDRRRPDRFCQSDRRRPESSYI